MSGPCCPTFLKHLAILFLFAMVGSACIASGSDPKADNPRVMAAAVLELITKHHTFGDGPPPFTEYLIKSSLDEHAGSPLGGTPYEIRRLADEERSAIELVVAPFGPVRWIEDSADWLTADLDPVLEGSVIIGVGEPTFDNGEALVPVSLQCGGLCGTWLTYRLAQTDQGWQVIAVEGPIAVS